MLHVWPTAADGAQNMGAPTTNVSVKCGSQPNWCMPQCLRVNFLVIKIRAALLSFKRTLMCTLHVLTT